MKYSTEVLIKLPREEVIKKFDNPDNLQHWQDGLISYEPLDGTPGEEGARSRLKYKMGKREIEMTETITKRNLPEEFHGTYAADGVYNIQENFFEVTPENHTRWTSHNEFQFKGYMKLMGLFMPGAFRKQTRKYMEDFKNFAEYGTSVKRD